jgi:integrase
VFSESEAKTDFVRAVYLTDAALAITQRLMQFNSTGPLFRNSRGRPWTTDAVNCAFTALQIKLGRKVLESSVNNKPKDRRRKHTYFDDATVQAHAKTLSPVKKSGEKKTPSELAHESRRKLTYREARELASKYCLYVLRHSWATHALERGLDSLTVAILMGHQDPSTLARVYQHLSHSPTHLLNQAKRAAAG